MQRVNGHLILVYIRTMLAGRYLRDTEEDPSEKRMLDAVFAATSLRRFISKLEGTERSQKVREWKQRVLMSTPRGEYEIRTIHTGSVFIFIEDDIDLMDCSGNHSDNIRYLRLDANC